MIDSDDFFKTYELNLFTGIMCSSHQSLTYKIRHKFEDKAYTLKTTICESKDEMIDHVNLAKTIMKYPHDNIIKTYNYFTELTINNEYTVNTIMEDTKGNLIDEIVQRRRKNQQYTLSEALKMVKDLLTPLAKLQTHKVSHCNLRPTNILITENCKDKSIDYKLLDLSKEANFDKYDEIDLNSASKDRFIYIKTKDNSNIEVNLKHVANFCILDLKKFVFPKICEEKNIRLIFNGRLLNENETITGLNFDSGAFVHAFISDKVEKRERTVTNASNNEVQNQANSIRGFERLKDVGIPQEDIILQKFAFHSHFVMVQRDPQIEFNNLVNREEEWYGMNIEKITSVDTNINWFRNYDFNDEADPERRLPKVGCFWLLLCFFVGFFLTLAIFPFVFARKVSIRIKEALIIGLIFKMFYICLVYVIIKELRFIV